MRDATLLFPIRDGRILLGLKKRGLGTGKWNGFGGKVEDETIEEAAIREAFEECGLRVAPQDLEPKGVFEFFFPDQDLRVHVFFARRFEGEAVETEEMRPRWYPLGAIPYERMWGDDRHWLPHALDGRTISGSFRWDERGLTDLELHLR